MIVSFTLYIFYMYTYVVNISLPISCTMLSLVLTFPFELNVLSITTTGKLRKRIIEMVYIKIITTNYVNKINTHLIYDILSVVYVLMQISIMTTGDRFLKSTTEERKPIWQTMP